MPEMTDNDRLLALYDQTADQSVKLARLTQRFEDCEKQFDQLFKRVLGTEDTTELHKKSFEDIAECIRVLQESIFDRSTQ